MPLETLGTSQEIREISCRWRFFFNVHLHNLLGSSIKRGSKTLRCTKSLYYYGHQWKSKKFAGRIIAGGLSADPPDGGAAEAEKKWVGSSISNGSDQ